MPADHAEQPWAIRSTLIAVSDLDRSVAFYQELGPFDVIAASRPWPCSARSLPPPWVSFCVKQNASTRAAKAQQALGLRSEIFNLGSLAELNRIESFLRGRDLFVARRNSPDGVSDFVVGRDPDNLPLVFVYYAEDTLGADYYMKMIDLVYSIDV